MDFVQGSPQNSFTRVGQHARPQARQFTATRRHGASSGPHARFLVRPHQFLWLEWNRVLGGEPYSVPTPRRTPSSASAAAVRRRRLQHFSGRSMSFSVPVSYTHLTLPTILLV
eukprot:695518-Pyramimonas_sp.AAC.1